MCVGGGGHKRGQSRTGMCVALLQTLTSDWHWCSHAHPSRCPPGFSAHPSSKYIPLEKPFEKIPPSPTPHTKNIQPRPPLHPHARWLFCPPPSFTSRTDAMRLLFFSLPLLLLIPLGASFFQLGISADTGSQGSQSLLQPTQLTTQTAKWSDEERASYLTAETNIQGT